MKIGKGWLWGIVTSLILILGVVGGALMLTQVPHQTKKESDIPILEKEQVKLATRVLVLPFVNLSGQKYQWYYSLGFRGWISSALGADSKIESVDLTYDEVASVYLFVKDGNALKTDELVSFLNLLPEQPTYIVGGSYSGYRSYQEDHPWVLNLVLYKFENQRIVQVASSEEKTLMMITTKTWCEKTLNAKFDSLYCRKKKLSDEYTSYDLFAATEILAKSISDLFNQVSFSLDQKVIDRLKRPVTFDDVAMNRFISSLAGERGYFSLTSAERQICLEKNGELSPAVGKKKPAVTCFWFDVERALNQDPSYVEANLFAAHLLAENGQVIEAKLRYETVIAKDDTNSEALFALAKISFDSGDFRDAVKYYLRLTELFPASSDAYYWLGRSYDELGQRDNAKQSYATAAELDPTEASARYSIIEQYEKLENYEKAIEELQKFTKLSPDQRYAWYQLAAAYRFVGRNADAVSTYRSALIYTPTDELLGKFLSWIDGSSSQGNELLALLNDSGSKQKYLENINSRFKTAFDELVWLADEKNPSRIKKCNEDAKNLLTELMIAQQEYEIGQKNFSEIVDKINVVIGTDGDLFFVPEEKKIVLTLVIYKTNSSTLVDEIRTMNERSVAPIVKQLGCEVPKSLPVISGSQPSLVTPSKHVVVSKLEPPRSPAPRSPNFNPNAKKFVTAIVENKSGEVFAFWFDGEKIDDVPVGMVKSFTVTPGNHSYCLIPIKKQCAGEERREAFFTDNIRLKCPLNIKP